MFVVVGSSVSHATDPQADATQLEYFEKHVRPVLAEHCYSCHSSDSEKLQAGLRVDSRAALLQGGDSGEAVIPGDASASLLIEAVRYESYEMPPKGKLPEEDIEALERWVAMGAPWPEEEGPTGGPSVEDFDIELRRQEHWVWQPIMSPQVPDVEHGDWPHNAIDHFVLNRLEKEDLRPAQDADRRALVRRIYFDLIGLPPTPEQVAAFLKDESPQAVETVIDQLLNSPHFGERWGRHWLDLMRYAESRGHEFDNDAPNAFQYRDYVIRALNADVRYDQFVREHIAGDLLDSPRLHPESGANESVLGTGFWFLGEWVHSPVDILKDESDRFDNMIDVMSKAFLGVTVACARCHDHKFDAISTADYYSLTGFLQSSDYRQVRFESMEVNHRVADELAKLNQRYQQTIAAELSNQGMRLPTIQPLSPSLSEGMVVDYMSSTDDYMQDGYIFGVGPRSAGTPYLVPHQGKGKLSFAPRSAAVSDAFWNGLVSTSEKGQSNQSKLAVLPRSGRTLRTPTFQLTDGAVTCRVRGEGHVFACVDSHRMVAGPLHDQTIVPIKPGQQWVTLNLERYVGHRLHLEFTPATNSQLEVSCVTQGATRDTLNQIEAHETEAAETIAAFARAVERRQLEDSPFQQRMSALVEAWVAERSKLQMQIARHSNLAMAMFDGTGEEGRVLIRGNSSRPGKEEARHFLTALSGDAPMAISHGSGRLELAEAINDPANPLTSRVIVNRVWHHLMGRGIVATTDDFGVLGQRPTHPELLDHLAAQFRAHGQSLKQTIRYVMLSRTYQMSSEYDELAVEKDPNNQWWHHRPPKRLEGEVIRDALLTLSGELDKRQFGEPVPIHLTPYMDGRGRPERNGPLDGDGRRSVYVAVRRNFLSPFLLAFDTPAPFSSMGRRNVSNVPAQALILMNDPLVAEQARGWAEQTLASSASAEERVRLMYESAFARAPSESEMTLTLQFLSAEATSRNLTPDDLRVWADFAHALINTKEFIFLR